MGLAGGVFSKAGKSENERGKKQQKANEKVSTAKQTETLFNSN